jgi:hypothetical protein
MAPPGFEELAAWRVARYRGALRDALFHWWHASTTALSNAGIAPVINEVLGIFQQIPLLMAGI